MMIRRLAPALLLTLACAACGGMAADPALANDPSGDAGVRASVAPTLKVGVDPTLFLPKLVVGYHPTAEEIATSGKACSTDADCATTGQVIFHCSTPYYGQAQCQGVFPAGDQVEPGIAPSCVYYDCPADFECETEPESRSVTCLASQHKGGRDA